MYSVYYFDFLTKEKSKFLKICAATGGITQICE